jgi:hypothetical protein
MVESSGSEHAIEIISLRPPDLFGHPRVAARCSCGWQGDARAGRNGREYAEVDGEAHLRDVKE